MATGMSKALATVFLAIGLAGNAAGGELHWNVEGGPRTGFHHTTGLRQASSSCDRQYSAPSLEACRGAGCCSLSCLYPVLSTCGGFNHWAYWSGCLRHNSGYCEPFGCTCDASEFTSEMGFEPSGLQELGQIPNDSGPLTAAP